MSLINPTPGDLADRQSILQIKLSHCGVDSDNGYSLVSNEILEQDSRRAVNRTLVLEKSKIDIQPFLLEHEAIQSRLELDWFTKLPENKGSQYDELFERLKNINIELWNLEDQARVLRAAPNRKLETVASRKAETLDAITLANELRADIVKRINALWDITTQEKIY